ncbi:hypothetical protein [Rhodococcoides corynebacterioides]|uniref:hypothetical protein n=1 Tax=Rhodococcoides corynebacterioides TaxID=53972 RepID=UPI003AE2AB00
MPAFRRPRRPRTVRRRWWPDTARWSLVHRLRVQIGLTTIVLLAGFSLCTHVAAQHLLASRVQTELTSRITGIVTASATEQRLATATTLFRPMDGSAPVDAIYRDGALLTSYPVGGHGPFLAPEGGPSLLARDLAARATDSIAFVDVGDWTIGYVAAPGPGTGSDGARNADGPASVVMVANSLDTLHAQLRRLDVALVIFTAAVWLVAYVLTAVVLTTGLRPVRRLRLAFERVVTTADLAPVAVVGDRELAALAVRFNAMMDAVDASNRAQKDLVIAAGEDLRQPLADLRERLDRAERDPDDTTIYRDAVARIDDLTATVNGLVDGARRAAGSDATEKSRKT